MKWTFLILSFVLGIVDFAIAQGEATNAIYEPWGSIHSLPEKSTLVGPIGYTGSIYISSSSKRVIEGTIYFSKDHSRLLVVPQPGPIFASTNSGVSWAVFKNPGTYRFPYASGPEGSALFVEVTVYPYTLTNSPMMQTATNSPNWYAVGSAPNGNKLIVTGGPSQSAPVLSIRRFGSGVIVSWPAFFTNFVLQQNDDLNTTNWVDVTNSVNVADEENQVMISPAIENNFYRLRTQ